MHALIDLVGYAIIVILIYQCTKLYIWISPVDQDCDTVFSSWPYIGLMGAVFLGYPFSFHRNYNLGYLFWGFIAASASIIFHLVTHAHLLHRASTFHGRYKLFWF